MRTLTKHSGASPQRPRNVSHEQMKRKVVQNGDNDESASKKRKFDQD
jgi:hypothetical protein